MIRTAILSTAMTCVLLGAVCPSLAQQPGTTSSEARDLRRALQEQELRSAALLLRAEKAEQVISATMEELARARRIIRIFIPQPGDPDYYIDIHQGEQRSFCP
jgi:hypothetical protein